MSHARLLACWFCAAALATAAESAPAKGLLKQSPFGSANNGGPAAAPAETIEFAGVSLLGKRTDLIFYDKAAKKSHWIAEGETKEGISVVSYDARREQVVVKLNGVEKTLPLRKGARTASSQSGVQPLPTGFNNAVLPAPAPAPVQIASVPANAPSGATPPPTSPAAAPAKPEGPTTPESQAKAETEARMLVSDLLEIGMAQRKAYEEAQRRAAEGNAAPVTPPQPGATPPAANPPPTQPDRPSGQ